jgi:hypothetical protein
MAIFDGITGELRSFIEAQHVFFVATAPLSANGHVNVSPKGLDTLRILDPTTIAYLDYVGSGAETIAHLRENQRIVVMLCAFDGHPRIVRLHGRGRAIEPQEDEFVRLRRLFAPEPEGRSVIHIALDRISTSCGFGVPLYAYERERTQLPDWSARKGEEGLAAYQQEKNSDSIDGLPALRWTSGEPSDETAELLDRKSRRGNRRR